MKNKSAGLARSLAISAAALAVVLGGCSNGVSSLNPFGGSGVSDVETVFLTPGEEFMFVSATMVREIGLLGGDVSTFVHPVVAERITRKVQVSD